METLEAYIKAYRALYEIHTHVMVVGIQAAVRGGRLEAWRAYAWHLAAETPWRFAA